MSILDQILLIPGIGRRSSFSPLSLFSSGEVGAWYDPSDLSTLFQERTGASATTPSLVGDRVGTILDLSGNGNHAKATTDARRGILRQDETSRYYIECDGSTTGYATDAIDFTGTNKITVFASIELSGNPASGGGNICEMSANLGSNDGTIYLASPTTTDANNVQFAAKGTSFKIATTTGVIPPVKMVLTGESTISEPFTNLRLDSVNDINTGTLGTGNFGDFILYLGSRGAIQRFFNGRIYEFVIAGERYTEDTKLSAERHFGLKARADYLTRLRVGFLGDSITSRLNELVTWFDPGVAHGWVNAGIGSNRLTAMDTRVDADIPSVMKACVLLGGINDIALGETQANMEDAIESIVGKLRARNITPYLSTVLPVGEDYLNEATVNAKVVTLNNYITSFASSESITLIDQYSVFDRGDGIADGTLLEVDAIHPTAAANILLISEIKTALGL